MPQRRSRCCGSRTSTTRLVAATIVSVVAIVSTRALAILIVPIKHIVTQRLNPDPSLHSHANSVLNQAYTPAVASGPHTTSAPSPRPAPLLPPTLGQDLSCPGPASHPPRHSAPRTRAAATARAPASPAGRTTARARPRCGARRAPRSRRTRATPRWTSRACLAIPERGTTSTWPYRASLLASADLERRRVAGDWARGL